jgi:hypothetical protein
VFKSWSMAEIDKRQLTPEEAATALIDLAIHYGGKAGLDRPALAAILDDRHAFYTVEKRPSQKGKTS